MMLAPTYVCIHTLHICITHTHKHARSTRTHTFDVSFFTWEILVWKKVISPPNHPPVHTHIGADWGFPEVGVAEWLFRGDF